MTDNDFLNNSGDHPYGVFKMSQLITPDMISEMQIPYFFFSQGDIFWLIMLRRVRNYPVFSFTFSIPSEDSVKKKHLTRMIIDMDFLIVNPKTGRKTQRHGFEGVKIRRHQKLLLDNQNIWEFLNEHLNDEIRIVLSVSIKKIERHFIQRCLNFYQTPNVPYYTFSFGEGIGNMYCCKQIFDHHSDYFKNKSSDIDDSFLVEHSHFDLFLRLLHGSPIRRYDLMNIELDEFLSFVKNLGMRSIIRKLEIAHLQGVNFSSAISPFMFLDMRRLSTQSIRGFDTRYCKNVNGMSGGMMKAFVNAFFTRRIEGTMKEYYEKRCSIYDV